MRERYVREIHGMRPESEPEANASIGIMPDKRRYLLVKDRARGA